MDENISIELRELKAEIALLKKPQIVPMESDDLNELYTALAKSQNEMETAKEGSANPFLKSKYADLTDVVKASRPYLTKNGLCVIQRIITNGNGAMYLLTRLAHASGQWIESKMPISPPKSDIQSIGSYITYLKRYTYSSIVGVTSSEDDDGESTMNRNTDRVSAKINSYELKELEEMLSKLDREEKEKILAWAQIKELADLTKEKFETVKKTLSRKAKSRE